MYQLHVFFFPFMAHGHMIPTLDIAKLFATHGVKSTIITTPHNSHFFVKSISETKKENNVKMDINVQIIKFPSVEAGLPEDMENVDQITSAGEINYKFFIATTMLKDPLEQLLKEQKPNCLVADMFFPWATDIAAKFKIPRLVFHGMSFTALCVSESLRLYKPQLNVSSDDEPFVLPNLPHPIRLTTSQLPLHERREREIATKVEKEFLRLQKQVTESEVKSYGVIVNSFYELEKAYADHYRNVFGRRVWHIGPLSLCNQGNETKANRGKETKINKHDCLEWLNSKEPNSVVYTCFGSMANFSASQLHEIATGLESSEQNFIWVVRIRENEVTENGKKDGKWLPEGFEERVKSKGLIIRGWAPQVLILDHEAIGCFVTHCGWNSTLESVTAGVPMVTWPVFIDQFYNEKLVTDILKIGVRVGVLEWMTGEEGIGIKNEAIAEAVKRVMVGKEAEEMRKRAEGFKNMAERAVEEGGSSYLDLISLLQELGSFNV